MSAIILFDGVCNFCNGWVNFVIRNDARDHFKFAPLQSETAVRMLEKNNIDPAATDSVVLIEDEKAYLFSDAALRIAKGLGGIYSLVYVLIVIPGSIRDAVYKFIAKNRYNWFGRSEQCMLPTPEIRSKFIT